MKQFAIEMVRVLLAAGILASAVTIFLKMGKGEEPPTRNLGDEQAQLVQTALVKAHKGGLDLDVDGVAAPFREIPIAAEVAGRILEKSEKCRAGKYVQEGEQLVVLDARDYELEVDRLSKEIEQAESNVRELVVESENIQKLIGLAEEDLEIQQGEVARLQDLAERKAASVTDVDQAKRARIAAQNGLTQLKNQIRLQNARKVRLEAAAALKRVQLERAELDLKRTKVTAPISGVVVSAPAEDDAYVQKGATLLTVEDTSRVEIRCQLQMAELYWLWGLKKRNASASQENPLGASHREYEIPQAPVTVTYELADQKFHWKGQLSRFEGIGLDEKTRTMPCRVVVPDPTSVVSSGGDSLSNAPPALIRGMFVKMQIHVPSEEPLLQIPEYAIRPGGSVWVVKQERMSIVPISIVRIANGVALVRKSDQVDVGTRIITSPLVAPRDGLKVRDAAGKTDKSGSGVQTKPQTNEPKTVPDANAREARSVSEQVADENEGQRR